jgi:hypothetical protein
MQAGKQPQHIRGRLASSFPMSTIPKKKIILGAKHPPIHLGMPHLALVPSLPTIPMMF